MKRSIIVGYGEVGEALFKIEKNSQYEPFALDVNGRLPEQKSILVDDTIEVVHICFPFKTLVIFRKDIVYYWKNYKPKLIIIHSTVPVGTTEDLCKYIPCPIVHSPIRGVHPELYKGLLEFVKYVGGTNESATKGVDYLKSIGLKAERLGTSSDTELMKILSTTYYGWNILFAKEAQKLCTYYGLDYDKVYTTPNKSYNEGYRKLGMEYVVRPVLVPPKKHIGGHCVSQNTQFLPESLLKKHFNILNM